MTFAHKSPPMDLMSYDPSTPLQPFDTYDMGKQKSFPMAILK
jgi:hypothetical protein